MNIASKLLLTTVLCFFSCSTFTPHHTLDIPLTSSIEKTSTSASNKVITKVDQLPQSEPGGL